MTKAITLLALTCLLVAGLAATSIVVRDSVPSAGAAMTTPAIEEPVVANRESKQDKLPVTKVALVSDAAGFADWRHRRRLPRRSHRLSLVNQPFNP